MTKHRLLELRKIVHAQGEELDQHRGKFRSLANGETPKVVTAFNLFQTPEHLAERMAKMADIRDHPKTLEPSAGLGRLYRAIRFLSACSMVLVDIAPQCCEVLYSEIQADQNAGLLQRDFLTVEGSYDRIVMNPPFKQGLDVKHILHALTLLAAGGKLVALCYNGTRQNEKLRPIANTWEVLPSGTFKEAGTMADVVLLTITRD